MFGCILAAVIVGVICYVEGKNAGYQQAVREREDRTRSGF